jgi:hypothetical protein
MSNDGFRFDNRIIAFIDILGMRQHLANPITEEQFARNITRIIQEVMRPTIETSVALPSVRSQKAIEVGFSGWRTEADCEITSISDSIVVSLPLDTKMSRKQKTRAWSVYQGLCIVFWLQRALVQLGILTRGAITIGKIHHTTSVVIGSGLAAAYELESQVAIYPRVVIGDTIVELLASEKLPDDNFFFKQRVGNMIAQDRDGIYFVDYLGVDITEVETNWAERLSGIEQEVMAELASLKNIRAKQKVLWLQRYVEAAIARISEGDNLLPHPTKGILEKIFPRHISENA